MSTGFQNLQSDLADGFVPFPDDRAEEYRRAGYWAGRPLESLLLDAAQQRPDHPAVVDVDESLSYAELVRRADAAAAAIAGLGIRPGDRVLLQLPNSVRFAVAFFGLLRAGAVPVMCLPGHRTAELGHFADVSGAVAMVIPDEVGGFDYREMAAQLTADRPGLRHVIVDGDAGPYTSWTALVDGGGAPPERAPVDTSLPALLLVSGGTTGLPKLIPRTHDDYVYTAVSSAQACHVSADDVYLVALPAGHNFPLACPGMLGAMTVGATTVFTADPSPEAAFALIDKHKVTVTGLVNALGKLWAQACEWEPVLPTSLRLVQVGGSRMSPEEARFILDRLTPDSRRSSGWPRAC